MNETYASEDEHRPHQDGADNPPKKDAILLRRRQVKIAEDQQEDEKIVRTEREFDNVAGGELQRRCFSLPCPQQHGKDCREQDPKSTPGQRLPHAKHSRTAMKHSEVERQHHRYENVKENPGEGLGHEPSQVLRELEMKT